MLRQPILILSLLSGMLPACNRSSEFSGKSATQTPEPPPPPLDAEPEPDPPPPPEPETVITTIGSIKGVLVPEPRTSRIWVATTTGNIHYLELVGNEVQREKAWTGFSGRGARTYVTETGVVIARDGGQLVFIDPEQTPEGPLDLTQGGGVFHRIAATPTRDRVSLPDGGITETRGCIVSYRRDGARFIGMGYGLGRFVEFPLDRDPPHAPVWDQASDLIPDLPRGSPAWGYSCFVDQQRMIYYSQFWRGGETMALKIGLPPDAGSEVSVANAIALAPNSGFRSDNLTKETRGPVHPGSGEGSYAIGGDPQGNIFNGTGYYTMAYEKQTHTVWASGRKGSGRLSIFPADCLSKTTVCQGQATYDPAAAGALGNSPGPLSSLHNGTMVGIARSRNKGQVYLMKTTTPAPSSGLEITPILEVEGDPYMYTDFTGATLYATESLTSVDLAEDARLKPDKPLLRVGFTWTSDDPDYEVMTDIAMEARCYIRGGTPPPFEPVTPVSRRDEETILGVDSCTNEVFTMVEVRLTQLNAGATLEKVRALEVSAYQETKVVVPPDDTP